MIYSKTLAFSRSLTVALAIFAINAPAYSQAKVKKPEPVLPVHQGKSGALEYVKDSLGNRIPDFSYCGYKAAATPIPNVAAKITVPVKDGDATPRIQAAIDYVSSLPADANGFKGAIQLLSGTYRLENGLKIITSGVVLRGMGISEANGTTLLGAGQDRETLITVVGKKDLSVIKEENITDNYVPVNANSFHVANSAGFKAGTLVRIHRTATMEWINALEAGHFGGGVTTLGWKPGERELYWLRTITNVTGNEITIDAPITTALDASMGGATISACTWNGRLSQVGIENLRCVSEYNKVNPKDEQHRWMAITINNTADAWVRQVVFEHFAASAVAAWEGTQRLTVEDCKSLAPVSEIAGQRRNAFWTTGQQNLFQRLYSEYGMHDFAVGYVAPGPNAFVQCKAYLPFSFSGAIDSWASGVLFDVVNIDGNVLSFANHGQDRQGSGWCAANSMFWQCTASLIECYKPPTAQNWAFGSWAQFKGDAYWNSSNEHIHPWSLYYAQLGNRLGDSIVAGRAQLLEVPSEASSSPPVSVAMQLTAASVRAHKQMPEWIDEAATRNPILVNTIGIKSIDDIKTKKTGEQQASDKIQLKNGWIVYGDAVATGRQQETPWWRGDVRPHEIRMATPAITRYVPGRTGTGFTDEIDSVVSWMQRTNTVAFEQHYGLWYERRRDDHERIRRMDGDVWPPFYELPFARSGESSGWDGLSKYDLTKYNFWYWNRMKQFADKAEQKGMVLLYENYFQHNIIEAGAHYVDFPWRTANNINSTGFPEPPPFAGDKRIFLADQFYDTTETTRRNLHRAYIFKCLDNFKDNSNVIQMTSAEYTGPLHFAQFWLNTIRDWQVQHNKKAIIALSVTKDVQDSILADPRYAAAVDIIDIRYWHYQFNGIAYQPQGGLNLAPRQHARLTPPKRTSFEQVYRAVHEYKIKFPQKAVMYSDDGWDQFGWASFIAGGSLAAIPKVDVPGFKEAAAHMIAVTLKDSVGAWALGNEQKDYIVYLDKPEHFFSALPELASSVKLNWIDPKSGKLLRTEKAKADKLAGIKSPTDGAVVLWISHN